MAHAFLHAQADVIYQAGRDVAAPTLVRRVQPSYSPRATAAELVGWVMLEVVVRPTGAVSDVRIAQSCIGQVTNHREPNGDPFKCRSAADVGRDQQIGTDPTLGLDSAAIAAAKQWTFTPGIHAGEPVSVRILISIPFHPPPELHR